MTVATDIKKEKLSKVSDNTEATNQDQPQKAEDAPEQPQAETSRKKAVSFREW